MMLAHQEEEDWRQGDRNVCGRSSRRSCTFTTTIRRCHRTATTNATATSAAAVVSSSSSNSRKGSRVILVAVACVFYARFSSSASVTTTTTTTTVTAFRPVPTIVTARTRSGSTGGSRFTATATATTARNKQRHEKQRHEQQQQRIRPKQQRPKSIVGVAGCSSSASVLYMSPLTDLLGDSARDVAAGASSSLSSALAASPSSWDELSTRVGVAAAVKTVHLQQILQDVATKEGQYVDTVTTSTHDHLQNVFRAIVDVVSLYAQLPVWQSAAVATVPCAAILMTAALYALSFPPTNYRQDKEPYPRGMYDPDLARAYYSKHPELVLRRILEVLRLSQHFLTHLLLDKYVFRREERNRPEHARELLRLITKLGPTAIKVGQALSVRQDIIPDEYANALASLQDQVPPFDGDLAKAILLSELGPDRYQDLKGIGLDGFGKTSPVASASIGQVYRGFVGDTEVAIKVQRPNVLSEIALDLYITREFFAPLYARITDSQTDLQALANEWGRGFVVELDYRKEAEATARFTDAMRRRNLSAVCAPAVVREYCTERVLVTEWVDGTRIDQSDAADIPRLCSVALNAYLVMLLELSSLHCDPHPGNLLRTRDGKLCILDFGMTLDIDPNLQYSLLGYVAHLTSDNYDELPDDMVKIGFLKADKLEFAKRTGCLEPLKYFLKKVGKGGGAAAIRERIYKEYREANPGLSDDELRKVMRTEMREQMQEVARKDSVATGITLEVEELQRANRDSFRIPEWFLYTSRAFLTLEGVSLQADPNYSIIKSCFPYIAKRLVADDDPRARKALKDLLYDATGASLDVDRLSDLADGFSSYTTTTKTINQQAAAKQGEVVLTTGQIERVSKKEERKKKLVEAEAVITLAKDSADILLAPGGNLVQNLLIEEGALAASARFKDTLKNAFVDGPKKFREKLPMGVGFFLPPLPFERDMEPFVRKTKEEVKAQQLAQKLSKLSPAPTHGPSAQLTPEAAAEALQAVSVSSGDSNAASTVVKRLRSLDPEQAAIVLKELRENMPKYGPLMGQLGGKFVSSLLQTASANIESTLEELEKAGERRDPVFRGTAKSLSSVAQRGAAVFTPTNEKSSKSKSGKPRKSRRPSAIDIDINTPPDVTPVSDNDKNNK